MPRDTATAPKRGKAAPRGRPLYEAEGYRLYPSNRPGRNHEIVFKPEGSSRESVTSAGTTDIVAAIAKVDELAGKTVTVCLRCKECGQALTNGSRKVADCIVTWVNGHVNAKPKRDQETIKGRLRHVTDYMAETSVGRDLCVRDIDDSWCDGFRTWMRAKGFVAGKDGTAKEYSEYTVEAPLVHLAAAFTHCKERSPQNKLFKTRPLNGLNRKMKFRADTKLLAAMLDYCINPAGKTPKVVDQRRRERKNLANYIRVAIICWARPEAIIDIDCSEAAGQWNPEDGMLSLIADGEEQTKKFRPKVPIPASCHWIFDECEGKLFTADPTQGAWKNMIKALKIPTNGTGDTGSKSIRRTMARLAFKPLKEHWAQVEAMMGHNKKTTTRTYVGEDAFDPDYFTDVLAFTAGIVDEIESLCPGAYYRADYRAAQKVVSIAA